MTYSKNYIQYFRIIYKGKESQKESHRDFPVVQWLRLHLLMQEVQVPSLVGEIRSHMLLGIAKNFFKRISYIKYIYIYISLFYIPESNTTL